MKRSKNNPKKQVKVCIRCENEYECSVLAANRMYCDDCLNEEIHLTCVYCGKDFILSHWKNKAYFKNPEKFKDKIHCSNRCAQLDPKTKKKKAKTCEEKYGEGITNAFMAEECKEKAKETCREHFGTDYAMQSEEGKRLSVTGIQAKYGDEYTNAFQVPKIKEKIKQTTIECYGCENISQNEEVKNKKRITRNSWSEERRQKYIDKMRKINLAYWDSLTDDEYNNKLHRMSEISKKWWSEVTDEWKVNWNSKNVFNGSFGVGTKFIFPDKHSIITRSFWESIFVLYLWYNKIIFEYENLCISYKLDGKRHNYFPDFYFPDLHYIVEIKGRNINPEKLIKQEKAAIQYGYEYEIIWDITPYKEWLLTNTKLNLDNIFNKSKNAINNKKIFAYRLPLFI